MTVCTKTLQEVIEHCLQQERPFSQQVLASLLEQNHCELETLSAFLREGVNTLEEYEIDLLFSPQFTPSKADKQAVLACLGSHFLTIDSVTTLLESVEAKALKAPLRLNASETVDCPLHPVMLERFVKLLQLSQPISQELATAFEVHCPQISAAERACLIRHEACKNSSTQALLPQLLAALPPEATPSAETLEGLLAFFHTYRPTSLPQLQEQLQNHIASCQADMENADTRGYHDHELQASHRGSSHDFRKSEQVKATYSTWIAASQQWLDWLSVPAVA